jgi:REP element-mobilizing transposase RayT
MNRGINGEAILAGEKQKTAFLNLLADKVAKYRMRLFAYAIMDTHYHLVLENASGRMSDFFRNLNTHYAFYYRKHKGGKGYVFQSRFVSTIIQDNAYLKQAIIYVLRNPVQAGIVDSYRKYPWSSAAAYFAKENPAWLAADFVQGLFGNLHNLSEAVRAGRGGELPVLKTRLGPVLGDEAFAEMALERYERRLRPDAVKKKRRDDFGYDPVTKVIQEFERAKGMKIEDIEVGNWQGKRMRTELLARLHDLAGLKFREIIELPIFSDLQYPSMSEMRARS